MAVGLFTSCSPISPQNIQCAAAKIGRSQIPTKLHTCLPVFQKWGKNQSPVTATLVQDVSRISVDDKFYFAGFMSDAAVGHTSRDTHSSIVTQGMVTMSLTKEQFKNIRVGDTIACDRSKQIEVNVNEEKTTKIYDVIPFNFANNEDPVYTNTTLIGRVVQRYRSSRAVNVILHSQEYHKNYTTVASTSGQAYESCSGSGSDSSDTDEEDQMDTSGMTYGRSSTETMGRSKNASMKRMRMRTPPRMRGPSQMRSTSPTTTAGAMKEAAMMPRMRSRSPNAMGTAAAAVKSMVDKTPVTVGKKVVTKKQPTRRS